MQIQAGTLKRKNFLRGGILLTLENLSVNFGDKKALSKINLKVAKGEILFVTGVSGAGKTTLLRCIAGDVNPSKGKVNGIERNIFISRVFQDLRLIQDLSVWENLRLSFDPLIYKNQKEFKDEAVRLCNFFSIKDRLNDNVMNLNGGLKQLIALIRSLLSKPELILLDEPTSSLDTESALRVFELLEKLNEISGLTCIWATHNRDLVKKFNGNIAYLDKGKLIYSGHACFI
ncbi:MAG: hypothetical protein CME68_10025 [Halobacteriovoraceae bacterium]|nr:hypothetical protein [Halobacteriovoraceae bacterium]